MPDRLLNLSLDPDESLGERLSNGGHDDDFSVEQFDAVVFVEDAGFAELLIFLDGKAIGVRVCDHGARVAQAE